MVATNRPLQEKMALFWHGHFATSEDKVRDYRKMLVQLELFQAKGTGSFRDLLVAVAQDPAMLAFLDAGVNVKGAPNENFAREIMELFTMGVGNYTEKDIREAARAFTGWNFRDLAFVVNQGQHDDAEKTVLGRTGRFDGVAVIDIILDQPATADFIAAKIYRYFVRQEMSPALQRQLGRLLRDNRYEIAPLLRTIFLSKDFYSPASYATHIKGPVELVVSTYRKLGLREVPGVPDFNEATERARPAPASAADGGRMGRRTGLDHARAPDRARELRPGVLFPDIGFIPLGSVSEGRDIRIVGERIAEGQDITSATRPGTSKLGGEMTSMSNAMADRDEDFNTRYASYRGWQMAIEKVKPIPRHIAPLDLTQMVVANKLETTAQVVDYFGKRFLRVPLAGSERDRLIAFLDGELGTSRIPGTETFLEQPLRMLLHLIMSAPEYQLG